MGERTQAVRKVKKLLNHAESAHELESEAEALAFASKAEEIMAEYKISTAEVEAVVLDEQDPITRELIEPSLHEGMKACKQRRGWEDILAHAVAYGHYCHQVVIKNTNARWFVGRKSDVEVAKYVFIRLAHFAEDQAKRDYRKARRTAKQNGEKFNGRGYMTSWRMAFAQTVKRRYAELEEERKERLEDDGQSTALVHLRDERAKVREWLDKNMSTRKASGTKARQSNVAGAMKGQRAGKKVSLRGDGVKGSSQGQLNG